MSLGCFYPFQRHLNDSIVADIMDYDEFITGMRNEAFFTMSKSFLPRLAAAPAAALPVALLGPLGHRPPVNGSIQEQSDTIVTFCKFITVHPEPVTVCRACFQCEGVDPLTYLRCGYRRC